MFQLFLPYILSFIFSNLAVASDCKTKTDAPLCPDSGSTLLDETYPTQAFVVSVEGFHTDPGESGESSEKLPTDFIISIMQSYSNDVPDIIVPASREDFALLLKSLEKRLLALNISQIEVTKKLSNIRKIETKLSYTWQQDYFESFINPETGRPVVREVSSYQSLSSKSKQTVLRDLSGSTSECEIENGGPLAGFLSSHIPTDGSSRSWAYGEMGGNIEALPGGLCMKGNNQADDFVAQYCGPKEKGNSVEIDVGWLMVGHVDEVIKVVPIFPKKQPEDCNFSIMIASPKKGIEILKSPEDALKKFIDLSDLTEAEGDQRIKDIINSEAGDKLCGILNDYKIHNLNNRNEPSQQGAKGAFLWKILNLNLVQSARASEVKADCFFKLKTITNKQMIELMERDEDFISINNLIQEKMVQNKKNMSAKLQERLPQCKNIKFIEVPDLFYGHGLAEVNGKIQLPEPGNVQSLFPNPTNSVLANETMIVSKSPNKFFNMKVKEELDKQGVKSKFVDTWNYAHSGRGNMHCSSHSLPYCRPRGAK